MFYTQFAFKGISKCFGEFRLRDVLKKRNLEHSSFVLNYSLIKIKFQLSLGSCHSSSASDKNVPISTPINGKKSSSFLRPIWNAWQNPVTRPPFTMPVDNKRIAGPEITQPVVLREGKRLRKPLVTSIVFFV